MIRRIQISLRPSDALVALVALHGPAADGPAPPGTSAATYSFGLRAGQEIARAFEAHARSLDVFGQCLDWLERRGIATVEYLVILICTVLVAAFAAKATGPHLVMMLLDMTMWLSLPVP